MIRQLGGGQIECTIRRLAFGRPVSYRLGGELDARAGKAVTVLQAAAHLDNTTTIAVVDAAARWLDEPDGEEYAYALLGAVTDGRRSCGRTASWGLRIGGNRCLTESGPPPNPRLDRSPPNGLPVPTPKTVSSSVLRPERCRCG